MSFRNNESKIYVGNLPPDIRKRDIEDLFYKFGKITFIDLKNSRGPPFAFVEFQEAQDAEDAVNARDGYYYDGDRLKVEFLKDNGRGSNRRSRRQPDRRAQFKCLVSGLPPTGSWQDLKDHMRQAGHVVYADVFKNGTGIVGFLSYKDMKNAVRQLDDSKFRSHEGEIRNIRVKEDYNRGLRSRSRSYSPLRRFYGSPYSARGLRSLSP